jgi:hypothetical protein
MKPNIQPELPLPTVVGRSDAPAPKNNGAPKKTRERKTIQDALITEGLAAVMLSSEVNSLAELQAALCKRLGQNSVETRRRYAQLILRWFFPDGFDGLLRKAWCAYRDDSILLDPVRWSYLATEPVMGHCITGALFPLENGLTIPASYLDKFLETHLGEAPAEKTKERLKTNLKKLGFLGRARGKPDRLIPVVPQRTSLLLLIHHLFAPMSVRTIELRHLFANPFWKYLGHKTEDAVRSVLREADAAGVIGKYIVADQLEQITTCVTLAEFLDRRLHL